MLSACHLHFPTFPSRYLHSATTAHFHDLELLLFHHLSTHNLPSARLLLSRSPQWKHNNPIHLTAVLYRFALDGHLAAACALFDLMPNCTVVTYNAMLSVYLRSGHLPSALDLFRQIPNPNVVTFTAHLSGLARAGQIQEARKVFDEMLERNVVTWNSMIAGLAKSGEVYEAEARKVFEEMPERNIVSWNAVIAGYTERGRMEEARRLFDEMGWGANVVCMVVIASLAMSGRHVWFS